MSAFLTREERSAVRRTLTLLSIDRAGFLRSVAAGTLTLFCTVGLAAVSAWLIARASQLPLVATLALATTSVRAFGASKPVFRYFRQVAGHRVALYGMSNLRYEAYARLADAPIGTVASIRRGDILARTGRDVTAVGDLVVRALEPIAVAVASSLVSVGIVACFSPLSAAALAACLLASCLLGPLPAMRGARLAERSQVEDRAELAALSLTMLESASELRVSGRLSAMEESARRAERRIFANRDAAARPTAYAGAVDALALGAATVAAILIGSAELAAGSLAPVELAIIALTPLAAFEATQPLGQAAVQLVRSAVAGERILALLDTASGEPIGESASRAAETPDPERRGQGRTPAADGRPDSRGRGHSAAPGLHARSLTVGWPDGPVVAGPFDIDVPRGGTLAVVGPSGIGKTTLLYTLAGLIRPRSGHVRLDGREVCDIPREEVSSTLVLTAEDAHVFATTVLENLRVARPDVTEEEAVELLDRAGLGGWLGDLPEGIHTLLGADATTMSGGERRRLLFARALASPADYLLLDEPAEHLDSDTADALVADLLAAGKAPRERERTVVLVTHRLTPLWQADRVILLSEEDGRVRVAAAGKHEELANLIPDYRWSLRQEL